MDYRSRRSHAIDINSLNPVTQIRLQKVECPACYSKVSNDSTRAEDELTELVVKTGMSVKNVSKALATSVSSFKLPPGSFARKITERVRSPASISIAITVVVPTPLPLRLSIPNSNLDPPGKKLAGYIRNNNERPREAFSTNSTPPERTPNAASRRHYRHTFGLPCSQQKACTYCDMLNSRTYRRCSDTDDKRTGVAWPFRKSRGFGARLAAEMRRCFRRRCRGNAAKKRQCVSGPRIYEAVTCFSFKAKFNDMPEPA
ncbi:hypothetical protein EVAR_47787_1 [Eumeta japonica]|uniref:Uncharacterized protein n=1 Tax=Eumeta variegata TaxID=151549 RepID=A0A4C1XTC9_EUMVA|nr:hypothetical protein EVAR_47787_1 [Eumeta japonica]